MLLLLKVKLSIRSVRINGGTAILIKVMYSLKILMKVTVSS